MRETGKYATAHGRPGEVYCVEPLALYKAIAWPVAQGLSYVTAFDVYVARWREVTTSLPEVDWPEDSELVPIMMAAVAPAWLQATVRTKVSSGKGPELVGPTTPWRKRAKEHLATLVVVIRENAQMAEMLRGTDALR